MNKTRLAATATASLALALAAAAPALATINPRKTAEFKMTVHGSEATTWSYNRGGFASTCVPGQHGNGSQMIRFETHGARLVTVKKDYLGDDQPSFEAGNWRVGALVEREGEMEMDKVIWSGRQCKGIKSQPPTKLPCGSAVPGSIELRFDWGRANQFKVSGLDPNFDGPYGLNEALGTQCELFASGPELVGGLIEASDHVNEAALFNRKRKTIKIYTSKVEDNPPVGFIGNRTVVAYNIVLKRVKH